MRLTKKLIIALYILIVVCIGLATVIEKYRGTDYVGEQIYGAWWFSALWAVLTVASCAFMLRQRLYKRLAVMVLHVSFVVILAGALTTHLFAHRGTIHLRPHVAESRFTDKDSRVQQLPFSLTLKEFRVVNYPGTDAPLDYQTVILRGHDEMLVSMNNIGTIDGYRFFQSSYDSDGQGVTLGVSYDPYGIAITYWGYLLLLVGMIATLLSRQTQVHTLYRKASRPLATLTLLAGCLWPCCAVRGQSVAPDIAHRMGSIHVLYNNRICPLNTVATDFVTKLSGNASWNGYSADEIFVSWLIYYSPWEQQRLIRIKSKDVQQLLGIDGQWACYSDFVDAYHEYKLGDAVVALQKGRGTIDKKALMDADEKYHLIDMFYRGQFIRMFPYRLADAVNWYMPGSQALPKEIPIKEQFFIKQSMDFLTESIVTQQHARAVEIIAKIKLFQRDMIGDVLPDQATTRLEVFYNGLRSHKWPVFLSLTLSLLLCVVMLFLQAPTRLLRCALLIFDALLLMYVTLLLALRWWLSGHIPVSNGHETMLFMAWSVLLLTFLLHRKFMVILGFGPLIASFCLLVSMLAGSSSQLTPLMPVLQSPLLSVHVMTLMIAYALFALQLLLGIQALILLRQGKDAELERTTALSQLLLYPAVFLLTAGIFLGAVWANVSWGNYWSWDPKESWALVTLMVYSVPLHKASLGAFRRTRFYHLYMIGAFLAVLVTYFGVNYLLGGMHSYA